MRIFTEFLGWMFSKTEPLVGIHLEGPEYWIVDSIQDGAAFYRSLIDFAPEGAIVCLEGPTESEIPRLLERRQVSGPTKLAAGTKWPKSKFFHFEATRQNLEDLATVIERNDIAIPAIHTHVYRGEQMLLEWYDAFTDEPIWISTIIDMSAVQSFAKQLGSRYHLESKNA